MMESKSYPQTGVAYVARLEAEYMHEHKITLCNTCLALGWNKTLSRCTGCKLVEYCSTECQKKDWPKHRKFCNMVQGKGAKNGYLSKFDMEEVYRIIIDSYRLRVETDHNQRREEHGIYYPGEWKDGLVWIQGETIADFQRFLDLAENSKVLPKSWSFETRMLCLAKAVDTQQDENIFKPIDQSQLITRYGGDTSIRTALSILAELVVGYEGKGVPEDGKWYQEFSDHLDSDPRERARLIAGAAANVEELVKRFRRQDEAST